MLGEIESWGDGGWRVGWGEEGNRRGRDLGDDLCGVGQGK